MKEYNIDQILWIDETGCDRRKLQRNYGYSIRGMPPRDHSLTLHGKRYSVIAVMSVDGVEDIHIVENNVNGDTFLDFIHLCILPIIMPFSGINPWSIVVMDNAAIHHVAAVEETLNGVGVIVRYLPAYNPDLNPIEEVFAEVKHFLTINNLALQATDSPSTMIAMAFCQVSSKNCLSYVQHSGY